MFDIPIQGFLVKTISLFAKFSLRQPKIQVVETVKNAHLGPPFTIAKLAPLTPISLCFVGDISIIYIYTYIYIYIYLYIYISADPCLALA